MSQMPLFPLNVVLFPGMTLPLHVFEERYKVMIGRCLEEELPFGVVLIKSGDEVGGPAVPFEVGTSAVIAQIQPLTQGQLNLVALGQERFRIVQIVQERPYMVAEVEPLASVIGDDPRLMESAHGVSALFAEYYRLYLALAGQWSRSLGIPENPATLADFVAARLVTDNGTRQELLETLSVARRLQREEEILGQEIRALTARLRATQRQRHSGLGALN